MDAYLKPDVSTLCNYCGRLRVLGDGLGGLWVLKAAAWPVMMMG